MKLRLIDNWRHGWKFWSVILGALGTIAGCADLLLPVWNMLPDDVRAILPADTLRLIGAALWVLALVARFVKQEKAHG